MRECNVCDALPACPAVWCRSSELEGARRAAAEAGSRAEALARREEEQRAHIAALEQQRTE